jgi:hypothetical protein
MRRLIPAALLSVCAEISATRETHASLDNLFTYAGAPGDPPPGSKPAKALAWLRLCNKDPKVQPLDVLGKLIEGYMEEALEADNTWHESKLADRERILKLLAANELQYVKGGKIAGALASPSRTLEEFIRERDIVAIDGEFNRALTNVESNPREAVSAASNILESLCKAYIEDEGLEMPAKQDLQPIWTVVRKDLGFDPSKVEDLDLQKILSGLISLVDGIGGLRTHASSAHGAGKKSYKLEPRHARLAVHAAHTAALFVLESWERKKEFGKRPG